jgi:hypothetical protein
MLLLLILLLFWLLIKNLASLSWKNRIALLEDMYPYNGYSEDLLPGASDMKSASHMLLFFDIASNFNSVFRKSCLMQCFGSHLDIKQPEQIYYLELVKIHEEGNELLCKLGNTLSEKETGFVEEM